MNEYESLNHTKWECKYHVVFIPKYRRKVLYGSLRKHLGSLFRELARGVRRHLGKRPFRPLFCRRDICIYIYFCHETF
jgi:hypothetical protein